MAKIHILIADDFAEWRARVREILRERPEWQIVDACDGLEALQKAAELRPDIVLLDVGMPVLNGIEAAKKIREVAPDSTILFATENSDEDVKAAALATGARGYLLKRNAGTQLLPAIETALRKLS